MDDDIIEISDTESVESYSNKYGRKRKHSISTSDSDTSSEDVVCIDPDSDNELDLECDFWDQDCIVLPTKPIGNKLHGFHLMPTCALEPTEAVQVVNRVPELSASLTNTETILNLQTNFENHNSLKEGCVEIITQPWRACIIDSLLQDSTLLDDVRQEFYEIDWNRRTMDLYQFFQSADLSKVTNRTNIRKLYDFICGDLKKWVATVTGLELSEVSATCSFYSDTDFLLVHDDRRGNRAVAFVIYLTGEEGWQPDWGGALQLLSKDDTGQPTFKDSREIYPKNNQLVLFPVTDHSYHQVLEVSHPNYPRLSVNGWYHTATPTPTTTTTTTTTPPTHTPPPFPSPAAVRPQFRPPIDLAHWIKPPYLQLRTAAQVQQYMEQVSEISLDRYVLRPRFSRVWQLLNSPELKWRREGPLNRRNYSTLIEDDLPEMLVEFLNVFKSGDFFQLLHEYTALELGHMRYEVQKWEPGDYNLLNDRQVTDMRLDVILYLCHDYDTIEVSKTEGNSENTPKHDDKDNLDNDNNTLEADKAKNNELKTSAGIINTPDVDMCQSDSKCQATPDAKRQSDTCQPDVAVSQDKSEKLTECNSPSTSGEHSRTASDVSKLEDVIGGRILYVTLEDKVQHALVTLVPNNNAINIVYGDTACFTSYVSKKNPKNCRFYVVFASYFERANSEDAKSHKSDENSD